MERVESLRRAASSSRLPDPVTSLSSSQSADSFEFQILCVVAAKQLNCKAVHGSPERLWYRPGVELDTLFVVVAEMIPFGVVDCPIAPRA